MLRCIRGGDSLRLPSADLGLMAEHLAVHEGVISKLKSYYMTVNNPVLKSLLEVHVNVLRSHVRVMLSLIDPYQDRAYHLDNVEKVSVKLDYVELSKQEKDITLEGRSTAMFMASDNFMSAQKMKNSMVKHVHFEMALQDVGLQALYTNVLQQINGDFTPKSTDEMQLLTYKKYYHVMNE